MKILSVRDEEKDIARAGDIPAYIKSFSWDATTGVITMTTSKTPTTKTVNTPAGVAIGGQWIEPTLDGLTFEFHPATGSEITGAEWVVVVY
jgi:hypothetical protein